MIKFPQTIRDTKSNVLWYVDVTGEIRSVGVAHIGQDLYDIYLKSGKFYSCFAEAELRKEYDEQELKKVQIPLWIDIDKAYEINANNDWYDLDFGYGSPKDWTQIEAKNVRLKSKPVVVTLNGIEYSWHATVKRDDESSERYHVDPEELSIKYFNNKDYGYNIHFTKTCAVAQLKFFKALKSSIGDVI